MPCSAKLGWSARTVAAPLLLSLVLHGLLLLSLWFWPARKPSPALTIESTRITLDTCQLDSPTSTLLPERALPADLLGANGDAAVAPQLSDPLPVPKHSAAPAVAEQTGGNESGISAHDSGGGSLFPLAATAASVVFVLDCSLSMAEGKKLDFARRELIASLRRLPPATRFQVIDYNDCVGALDIDGQRDLLPAEPAIIDKAILHLQALAAAGKSNHVLALRRGLDLHPDVLYFLTDADDLKSEEVALLTRRNQRTIVHTIELTHRRADAPDGPLAQLARENHGVYRRVALGD